MIRVKKRRGLIIEVTKKKNKRLTGAWFTLIWWVTCLPFTTDRWETWFYLLSYCCDASEGAGSLRSGLKLRHSGSIGQKILLEVSDLGLSIAVRLSSSMVYGSSEMLLNAPLNEFLGCGYEATYLTTISRNAWKTAAFQTVKLSILLLLC